MSVHANRTQMMRALLSLREQILSGEFKPGDRMSELPLVERLGVSRSPLRLALASLEHEGLLRTLPSGGYVVREFTRADIRDAIEIRGMEGFPCTESAVRAPRCTGAALWKRVKTTVPADKAHAKLIYRLLPNGPGWDFNVPGLVEERFKDDC